MPPLTLCAYMKKGPNLRWSLIQCSGGDEGDRTPDLLTASQALSQLSYAPVRRSTIRELGRRCKDNFGKTFCGAARVRPIGPESPEKARGARPAGGGHAAALLPGPFRPPPRTARHETGPSTTFCRHPPTMVSRAKIKPQVDGLRFSQNTGYGRWVRVKRSKWAGFVAGASWMTAGQRLNVGNLADSGQILLSLKKNRPDMLPDLLKILVGPPGFEPRTQGL